MKTTEYDAFLADLAPPPYFVSMEDGRGMLVCDRLVDRNGAKATVILETGAAEVVRLEAIQSIGYGTPTSPF